MNFTKISLLGAYFDIREFYVCVCPSLRFGFIIYLITGRLCVILYAIDVSLSFQALSDGLGLNAIEFQHVLVLLNSLSTLLWSLCLKLNNYHTSLNRWHNVGPF